MAGLTKRRIDAAKYAGAGNSRDVRWDDNPHGLGLRLFPSGRKSFVLMYRLAGRKHLMALADYGVLTLEAARKRARAELAAVEGQNTDPLAERRKRALEARTGTVETLFRAYVEARTANPHRPMKRPDAPLWYGDKFIFPRFGSKSWREVRRSEVREWHAEIAKPYNANRALQAMRAAYYWRLWQEDDSSGQRRRESDTRNPCAGIDLRIETRRQVRLELAELPRLEKAVDAQTADPYLRAYFRFVLATGCRRGEALALKWRDVEDNAVTFRNTKAGTDHTVPLSAYAARLLKDLPRLANNPHVFVSRQHGKPLAEPSKAWQKIRQAAGLKHLRIHDLRRTFGSWLGDAGFTSKQIGATLGHKSDITSRVYMALGDQSKRAAVDAVDRLMQGKPAKVSKLPSARKRRA
jgi:integrase